MTPRCRRARRRSLLGRLPAVLAVVGCLAAAAGAGEGTDRAPPLPGPYATANLPESPYLPADGWPVGPPVDLRRESGRAALHRVESPHFVVYTTVSEACATQIAEHAEVFYAAVAPLFPGQFYDPMMESRVEVRFFAYPEERAAFVGARRNTRRWSHYYYVDAVDCLGIPPEGAASVRDAGRVRIHLPALQHELVHGITARYFGRNGREQPIALAEGFARFLEGWDIRFDRAENLRRIPRAFGGNLVQIVAMFEGVDARHAWVPLGELLQQNRFAWEGTPYQQGFALAAFFLSEEGGAHWEAFCTAYRRYHYLLTDAGRKEVDGLLSDAELAALRTAFRAYLRDRLTPLADAIAGPGWRESVRQATADAAPD